ncbi:MAG: PAN domain-containing protein [Methylobacteriaceae bacterium]|nr:PAN domain-containing protein [Methylobacteriaceae bacterium]MBV9245904.1 PAN domain-containing protein [Methylobacteriaceae bacterium]
MAHRFACCRPAAYALALGVCLGSALAYEVTDKRTQPGSRDQSGKIVVEGALISIVACKGPRENGGTFYIYQYTDRQAFRAILPPDWGKAIGGKDFATFDDAVAAACSISSMAPKAPPPAPSDASADKLLEPDTDRPGQDYRDFDLSEAPATRCALACLGETTCRAFTYLKPGVEGPKAHCWLKTGVPDSVASSCCISGVVKR